MANKSLMPTFAGFNYDTEQFSSPAVEAENDWFKVDRSAAHALSDWGPSLTRQEFADEADINILMKRYEATGVLPWLQGEASYVDWTDVPTDLASALQMMTEAEGAFMQLPAKVRREFDNDPVRFTEFATDPANMDQLRDWGLAKPRELPDAPRSDAPAVPASPADSAQDAPKAS